MEKYPSEIRAWHLLGLLLSAQGDWHGAQAVLELGLAHADDQDDDEEPPEVNGDATIDGLPRPDGVLVRDFAPNGGEPSAVDGLTNGDGTTTPTPATPIPRSDPLPPLSEPLLPTTLLLPPSYTLLAPIPDIPRSTSQDRFEASLQLRMTQLSLTELVEGADTANQKWPEVFLFFSEGCPSGIGHAQQSNGNGHSTGPASTINPSIREWELIPSPSPETHHRSGESYRQPNPPPDVRTSSSDGGQSLVADAPRIGMLIPPSPGPGDLPSHRSSNEDDSEDTDPRSESTGGQGNLPKRILHRSQRQMHSLGQKVTHEAKKLDGSMRGLNRKLHKTNSAPG